MKVFILSPELQQLYQSPRHSELGKRIPRQVTHSFLYCIDQMEATQLFSGFAGDGTFPCKALEVTEAYSTWTVQLARGFRLTVVVDHAVRGLEEVWVLRLEAETDGGTSR